MVTTRCISCTLSLLLVAPATNIRIAASELGHEVTTNYQSDTVEVLRAIARARPSACRRKRLVVDGGFLASGVNQ